MDNSLKRVVDKLELEKKLTKVLDDLVNGFVSFRGIVDSQIQSVKEVVSQLDNQVNKLSKEFSYVKKAKNFEIGLEIMQTSDEIKKFLENNTQVIEKVDNRVNIISSGLELLAEEFEQQEVKVEKISEHIKDIKIINGKDGRDGVDGKDGTTTIIREKSDLNVKDFENIAEQLTSGILTEKKMTTKAIRNFREESIKIASEVSKSKIAGVERIVAGDNVTLSPTGGTGVVTISAIGGGTGAVNSVDGQTGDVDLSDTYQPLGSYLTNEIDPVWTSEKSDYSTKETADGLYEPKNSNIQQHITSTNNPHGVTAEQVGALTSETDPVYSGDKSDIVFENDNISRLVNDAGYLTSLSETDPVWESEKINYATKKYAIVMAVAL
jgi:hypothetical protein